MATTIGATNATSTIGATTATSTSGLDVSSIVSQLMTVEQQPITQLDAQEASYQAQLSAYGTIKSAVASFQTALQGLTATTFKSFTTTPSDTSVFSANASSIAAAGTYSISISSLAQSQQLIAAGQASSTAAIGDGTPTTVTFDFGTISGTLSGAQKYNPGATFVSNGNGIQSITIDSSNNTLEGIRDAINAANIGVTATLVNDGSATPYRLVLSSGSTGVSNSLKITTSGDPNVVGSIANLLTNDPAGTQELTEAQTAQNANLTVNGLAVTKPSNSISDVIHGVTLNLTKTTLVGATNTPVSLKIDRDTGTISTAVSAIVKAYNDLSTALNTASAYDATTKTAAALQGDSTIFNLQAQLRSILGSAAGDSSDTLRTLSDVGVSFQKDGTLALDQTKLNNAMTNNFSDISALFSSDNGYVTRLNNWTTSVLSSDGTLANRTDGIGRTITDIGNQRTEINARLANIQARYIAQFTALDGLLSSMNSTSSYLTQQLAAVSANSKA